MTQDPVGRPAIRGGIAIGLAASLATDRPLTGSLYEVSPADPLVLAAVSMLLVVVTVLAALPTVSRVLDVEPATVLRSD